MKVNQQHIDNLESHLEDLEFRAGEFYIDEVRFSPKTNYYYVAMRSESRKGLMEFHLDLDWSATHAPSVAAEITTPFHRNDFSKLLYKASSPATG